MSRKSPNPIHRDWLVEHSYRGNGAFSDFPPVSLSRDGQLHYPGDRSVSEDTEWANFDSEKDKWLGLSRFDIKGAAFGSISDGGSSSPTASNVMWMDYATATLLKYGNNVGWPAPYDLELCTMSAQAVASSTCTVSLSVNNATHTGADLTLTAATSNQADGYTCATINKGDYLGLYISSGTFNSGTVWVTFRRVMYE